MIARSSTCGGRIRTQCIIDLWRPVVPGNSDEEYLLGGLHALEDDSEEQTGMDMELVINEQYTEKIEKRRQRASETEKDYGELEFRILQILEHLR